MRYLSIDLETTGLDPQRDQILHFAAVLEDTGVKGPLPAVEDLPFFECILIRDRIEGGPYALTMNAELIAAIAAMQGRSTYSHVEYRGRAIKAFTGDMLDWWIAFTQWLYDVAREQQRFVVAGKNAAGFDLPFIRAKVGSTPIFHHRVIDAGSVALGSDLTLWNAASPPGLGDLIDTIVQHDALADARDVVRALRRAYDS